VQLYLALRSGVHRYRLPGQRGDKTLLRWRLIYLSSQYGTCFMPPFWRLEFWTRFYVDFWETLCIRAEGLPVAFTASVWCRKRLFCDATAVNCIWWWLGVYPEVSGGKLENFLISVVLRLKLWNVWANNARRFDSLYIRLALNIQGLFFSHSRTVHLDIIKAFTPTDAHVF
jgi:hypothetical protein